MTTPEQIYRATIAGCPRSQEWKLGAMAGLKKGQEPNVAQRSPFPSGTAQDDAWAAGLQYGRQEWTWNAKGATA